MTSPNSPSIIASGTKWILPDGKVIEWRRDMRIGDPVRSSCLLIDGDHPAPGSEFPKAATRGGYIKLTPPKCVTVVLPKE